MSRFSKLKIGVLAIQGDFECHIKQLSAVGVNSSEVRLVSDLEGLDALIFPGGESTTMSIMIDRFDMRKGLRDFVDTKPIWGTCAGVIMLADSIEENQSGVIPIGGLPVSVIRNGYGRQLNSNDSIIEANFANNRSNGSSPSGKTELKATFIRAPRIVEKSEDVEVLSTYESDPVLVAYENILASTFHTELDDDSRLLEFFLDRFCLSKS